MKRVLVVAAIAVAAAIGALAAFHTLPLHAQNASARSREAIGPLPPPLSKAQRRFYSQHPQALQDLLTQLARPSGDLSAVNSPAATPAASGTWTPTTNSPPAATFGLGNPIVLTDGTVIVHANCSTNWYRLTPDPNSSFYNTYINGTWSQIASLPSGYTPLYFGSAVLPDGRFIAEGGEYNSVQACNTSNAPANDTTLGAIYNAVTNTWTAVAAPSGWSSIGDASSIVLANGTFMLADCCTASDALLNPATLTWTPTGFGKIDGDNDEEGWTLLPNGNVLAVDAYVDLDVTGNQKCPTGANPFRSELYNPSNGNWSDAGSTIVQLPDCGAPNHSYELGPQVLRPDGTVVAFGGTTSGVANTAIYNSTSGTWSAGPTLPVVGGLDYTLADAPAALLNNGNILFAASPGLFMKPVHFFELSASGNTITQVGDTPNAPNVSSYQVNFVVLPTGQILETDQSNTVEIYQANGGFSASWQPTISSVPANLGLNKNYSLNGTQLSGLSQGAAYGDDTQANTNFPLVIIENLATTHTYYARTFNWKTSVAPGANGTFSFTVPSSAETGPSSLFVIGDGIYSPPISVTIQKNVAAHDFNNDGMSDVLLRDSNTNTVADWLMNGAALKSALAISTLASNWAIVGTGDFDGDGVKDILLRDANTNTIAIWEMNAGTIKTVVGVGVLPGNWSIVGTGDFDGDGKTDILIRDSNTNTVGVWEMNGGAVKAALGIGVLPSNWSISGTGDFDGDGNSDVLLRDSNSNTVAIWQMNGATIKAALSVGVLPGNWAIIATGDFNGDAKTDLLIRDNNSSTVGIWEMNGNLVQAAPSLGVLPGNWAIAGSGDFNGDGISDVLWRDSNTNTVAVWQMSTSATQTPLSVGILPGNWIIQNINEN